MAGSVFDKPVSSLKLQTYNLLAANLTLKTPKMRDWTGIATFVGFTAKQLKHIEQSPGSGKGWVFLATWDSMRQSSIRKLVYALLEHRMQPCLDILGGDPDISEEAFESVKGEFQLLKQEDRLKSLFPQISEVDFSLTFYADYCNGPTVSAQQRECQVVGLCGQPPEVIEIIPNTVFISYLSEPGLLDRRLKSVLSNLAEVIRIHGFTVFFKPFCENEIRHCGGVNNWKESFIPRSENIVVVCTPNYYQEDCKWPSNNRGQGLDLTSRSSKIQVDSLLLRQLAFSTSERERLIPITLDFKNSTDCIPIWLRSAPYFHFPGGKKDFLYCLKRVPILAVREIDPTEIIDIKPTVIGAPKHTYKPKVVGAPKHRKPKTRK